MDDRPRHAAAGVILGALLWVGAGDLGLHTLLRYADLPWLGIAALAGGSLALTRARIGLWVAGALLTLALITVSLTPLVPVLARSWGRVDSLLRPGVPPARPIEAVVALSAQVYRDGTFDDRAQLRLLRAYELLGGGYARRLVVTRIAPPSPSSLPAVHRQLRELRLDFPVDEVGPTQSTREEALAVARLARQRGWKQVILVTDPLHMRRAAAVFGRAGVETLAAPCLQGNYNLSAMQTPGDRRAAFRDWLREFVGYQVYRLRGWI